MSKLIYQPKFRAGEYAKYAVNYYNGCTGCCTYCYNRTGRFSKLLGADKPTLKKAFSDEKQAFYQFEKEIRQNVDEYRQFGIFFPFVSDPCLKETINLTLSSVMLCDKLNIPTTILTKQTWWRYSIIFPKSTKIGFTLTGIDKQEPGCATNFSRLETMFFLKTKGYQTLASIEPIIDLCTSYDMIISSRYYCDHYKIGLQSGKKYNKSELIDFFESVNSLIGKDKIYWKKSFLEQAEIKREDL